MSRSRLLLLGAWGVLVVGSVLHFALPDANEFPESRGDVASETQQPVDELAYRTTDDAAREETDAKGVSQFGAAEGNAENLDGSALPVGDQAIVDEPVLTPVGRSFVASVIGDGIAVSSEPGGTSTGHWFPNPTQFGGQRVFLVTDGDSSPDFLKVALPTKPNGQEGWIARSAVIISEVEHRAVIDLSDDTVTVWHGDQVVVETKAVTGKPSTPTPVGLFYVRDIIAQPDATGSYGPFVVALSGFSDVLDSFNGALPAIAIHGTNRPEQMGSERSSGCIRIPNELISVLAGSVPLGTPVTVVA